MRPLSNEERLKIAEEICKSVPAGAQREFALHMALCGSQVMTRREFLEQQLKIKNKKTGVVGAWKMNRAQRCVEARRIITQRAGLPERYCTLKSRKWGFSTLWLTYGVDYVTHNPNVRACVIADQTSDANALLEDGRLIRDSMPFKLATKYDNRATIYFAPPLSSAIDIETAQNDDPCRGRTYRFLHVTEPQLYKDPEKKAIAFENSVPDEPGTVISYEGTGAGMGWWHDFWMSAHENSRALQLEPGPGWFAFFFPWWYDKTFDYTLPLRAGEIQEIMGSLDAEERELVRMGLDAGQLKWRRFKLRETFRGNVDLFHQEFPATPREAFLSSGRPVFVPSQVLDVKSRSHDPIWRGDILVEREGDKLKYRLTPNPRGMLTLWDNPRPGVPYVMGADVGHGVAGGDSSVAIVMDARNGHQVATLYCNPRKPDHCVVPAKDFGRLCVALGEHFNWAYFLPEVEGPGIATMASAREEHYPAIGRRESYDKVGRMTIEKHGWSTNAMSRPMLFNEIREHLGLSDGAQFHDHRLADEMLSMVFDDSMSEDHPPGGHDDLVFAWGITLVARRLAIHRGLVQIEQPGKSLTEDQAHWKEFHDQCEASEEEGPDLEEYLL